MSLVLTFSQTILGYLGIYSPEKNMAGKRPCVGIAVCLNMEILSCQTGCGFLVMICVDFNGILQR